ncbi:MAG: peptidase S10 [Candidatus Eremiobacteraeota bacterium]|nr:peptidase S10 [Candidatus Eremiobacteraeota bacterium]
MRHVIAAVALALAVSPPAVAQEPPPTPSPSPSGAPRALASAAPRGSSAFAAGAAERPIVTHHRIRLAGREVAYAATAGIASVRGADGKPTTTMSYIMYAREGADTGDRRPVSFIYNGGPGSSTIWLHMGAFGPRRVVTANGSPTPPAPYRLADNENTLLDVSDLVFVDAPGTGFGRALDPKAVFGVDQDAQTFASFIQGFVTTFNRWNSPKFLIGESYGTTRSANVVNVLAQRGIACSGVVLISTALDYATFVAGPGNDLPYILFLPTMTAVAAYHHALPQSPANLDALLAEVRRFAETDYAAALLQGDRLDAASRARMVARLHGYTGLPAQYIDLANLRVGPGAFEKELLRPQRRTIGRLDGRFLGIDRDPLGEAPEYDPTETSMTGAYVATFESYSRNDLDWRPVDPYRPNDYAETGRNWDFRRTAGFGGRILAPSVIADLAQAMTQNPALHVFAANGLYDLATPFMGTEYTLSHMLLDRSLLSHVQYGYYPSGHMIYVDPPSHARLTADLRRFITEAGGQR